jgi:hypothetical protein
MAARLSFLLLYVLGLFMAISGMPISRAYAKPSQLLATNGNIMGQSLHRLLSLAGRITTIAQTPVIQNNSHQPTPNSCFCASASICCYLNDRVDCGFGLCGLGS